MNTLSDALRDLISETTGDRLKNNFSGPEEESFAVERTCQRIC